MSVLYSNDNYHIETEEVRYPAAIKKDGAEYNHYFTVVLTAHDVTELKTTSYVEALSYATASNMALQNRSWDWTERLSEALPGETPQGGETMQ